MAASRDAQKSLNGDDNDVAAAFPESPHSSSEAAPDLDDNYDLYKQQAGEPLDSTEAKRVLRKIDLRVVPVLFIIYLLQYLDKNGINYACVERLMPLSNPSADTYA